ncbi:DUF4062 domain-containing protein [Leptospira yasudae]|uniref:DUF4062 domain-containing protein n=1 Tax=Leptospira yasudae TaxID=2202201 RepID=UPI001C4F0D55|nr:DUF4062 domain-containing protein [Leptospira yasudae]MBW0434913.1 DUF4062 domain-containing protein [Leptospira yasudae]
MAIPKVFISSTCYDLNDVRDSLSGFIKSLGYEPILSENGDVFFHPDLHTHESCIKEITNCHLFIVIIGGRFGGSYVYDINKSIVNAEYYSAKSLNIPIFSFVKRSVYEDHRVYSKNKSNEEVVAKVIFPAIDKQETAVKIFNFIDEIRLSQSNNSIYSFDYAKEINEILRKQFAGMLYDFLLNRKHQDQIEKSNVLLDQLNTIVKRTEEIVENVYKKIEPEKAGEEIEKIETKVNAQRFIQRIVDGFNIVKFENIAEDQISNAIQESHWWLFLERLGGFTTYLVSPDGEATLSNPVSILFCEYTNIGLTIDGEMDRSEKIRNTKLTNSYAYLRKLPPKDIYDLMLSI